MHIQATTSLPVGKEDRHKPPLELPDSGFHEITVCTTEWTCVLVYFPHNPVWTMKGQGWERCYKMYLNSELGGQGDNFSVSPIKFFAECT